MKTKIITIMMCCIAAYSVKAQYLYQYFDGADTNIFNSIKIEIDTNAGNIWQVGKPQKIIFDSAATNPNVIVTDTINNYPVSNTSSFMFKFNPSFGGWGVTALQWKQKLDMNFDHDGGIVEYSVDTGATWHNTFNDPNVYNYFGFNPLNKDTLINGSFAFSGTDTTWKDVWLCFQASWLNSVTDSLFIKYTFSSDTLINNKEGWMIDNMMIHTTFGHPVTDVFQEKYINVYPNPAREIVNIELKTVNQHHIIEQMQLINFEGKTVKEWEKIPTRFWFYTREFPEGNYFLKVKTNIKSETIPIVIKRD